jgi:hypothetical protein
MITIHCWLVFKQNLKNCYTVWSPCAKYMRNRFVTMLQKVMYVFRFPQNRMRIDDHRLLSRLDIVQINLTLCSLLHQFSIAQKRFWLCIRLSLFFRQGRGFSMMR